MWILFLMLVVILTAINLYLYFKGKDYKLAMALGLAFTILFVMDQYRLVTYSINLNDWVSLLDVVPTMHKTLWTISISSIILNTTPILLETVKKRKAL